PSHHMDLDATQLARLPELGTLVCLGTRGGHGTPWYHLPAMAAAFSVIRRLARGELADVLLASVPWTTEEVIVKRLREDARDIEEVVRLFHRELGIARSLAHPNIVRVLEVGTDGEGLPYFVMERLDGSTLLDVLEYLRARGERPHPA